MKNITFDILLNLKDRVTGRIEQVNAAFEETRKRAAAATGQAERFGGVCRRLEFPNLQAMTEIAQTLGGHLAAAANAGMEFGQSMADLSSITGIAGSDLAALEENARRVGRESGLGASESARAYSLLASQIEVADIGMDGLNTLLEKSVTLAQASGMGIDAAANALAGTVNQFGLGADQAERIINVLAAGSKYGAAEIEDLSQSFKVVGASAAAMGLDVESTAGALEVLSKANLKGSESGTALRNILLKLSTSLGIDLKVTSLSDALRSLQPQLDDVTFLTRTFGMENVAAAQFLIQNAGAVAEMTAKVTATSTAQEQAATRTQTTAHRMAVLRARMDDLKISVANATGALAPYIALLSENAATLVFLGKGMGMAVGGVRSLVSACKTLTAATATAHAAQTRLNLAVLKNPYVAAAAAIAAMGAALYAFSRQATDAERAQSRLQEVAGRLNEDIARERLELDNLFAPLLKAKEGTDEWNTARQRVMDRHGSYLASLGNELESVAQVEAAYKALTAEITRAARARAMQSATQGAADAYVQTQGKELDFIGSILTDRSVKNGKLTAEEAERTMSQIREAVLSGSDIPGEAQNIIDRLTEAMVLNGGMIVTNNEVDAAIGRIRSASEAYGKELERARAMFGDATKPGDTGQTPLDPGSDPMVKALKARNAELERLSASMQKPQALPAPGTTAVEGSIARLEESLRQMRTRQAQSPLEVALRLSEPIEALQQRISAAKFVIDIDAQVRANLDGIASSIEDDDSAARAGALTPTAQDIPGFDLSKPLSGLQRWNRAVEQMRERNAEAIDGLSSMGTAIGAVGKAVGGAAGAWLEWGANLLNAIAAAIPQIMALTAAENLEGAAAGKAAASKAASSVAGIPFAGPALAVAAIASVVAALMAIPKFAEGGIAYGPTLGLFGEYAGAASNPEVVAPLSRLKALISDSSGGMGGKVTFRIKGRTLEGVLQRQLSLDSRS